MSRPCTYCPDDGADVCVRTVATSSGPDRPVFAHRKCAKRHGIRPLYEIIDPTPAPTAETAQ
jgi:hypothetical protein